MAADQKIDAKFDAIPPHIVCDGFMGNELRAALLEHAMANQDRFTQATIGVADKERVYTGWRISHVMRDFGPLKSEVKNKFRSIIETSLREFGTAPFDLHATEIELAAHGNGAFYNTHIDTATDRNNQSVRVLSAVYYFHAMPKAFSGGNLRLLPLRHNAAEEKFLDIEPLNDRLLVFPSWVPHQVMPVSCPSGRFVDSRFAINCWFRKLKA